MKLAITVRTSKRTGKNYTALIAIKPYGDIIISFDSHMIADLLDISYGELMSWEVGTYPIQ